MDALGWGGMERSELAAPEPPGRDKSPTIPSTAPFKLQLEGVTESPIPAMSGKAADVLLLHWTLCKCYCFLVP